MKRPAIIFDFGGVIVQTHDRTGRHQWDERLGLQPGSVEQIVHGGESWRKAQLGIMRPEEYWRAVAAQLGIAEQELPQFQSDYFSGDRVNRRIVALIRQLKAAGYVTALLSNDSLSLRPKLQRLGIAELFEPLVISAEIGVMKPDAAAYEAVLQRIPCAPEEAVFIDDMALNVDGAEAIGIKGIQYRAGMDLEAVLRAHLKR